MSDQQLPDVSDPDVRETVLVNHAPHEVWDTRDPKKGAVFGGTFCAICRKPWPCPSIEAARASNGQGRSETS